MPEGSTSSKPLSAKRAPFQDTEVEIRQVVEVEDFGPEFTLELREQEERLRAQFAPKD